MINIKKAKLDALIAPKSIAVIGASPRKETVGWAVFSNLLLGGYQGILYPVNPTRKSILGVKSYPSVLSINDEVDLAIIIVKSVQVPQILDECGKAKVKSAIVISAGFKEIGQKGAELEADIVRIAREHQICMIGPNCLGVINTDPEVAMNATFAKGSSKSGNISFISQSGALGVAALEYAKAEGIGLSKFFSVGNKADITENDLLWLLKDDPKTDVILMYLEDLADHREFIEVARMITGDMPVAKPIIAIKSGRTREGARAVSSHTGSLAGSDTAYESAFIQSGVIRVETMEELFDLAVTFANAPIPRGNRIGIITNGGGAGIMATDAAIRYGLKIPDLTEKTRERIKAVLPPEASVNNPVDVLGDAISDRYYVALHNMLEDPNIDGVIVIAIPQLLTANKDIARTIASVAPNYKKPCLVSLMTLGEIQESYDILEENRIPHYRFPEVAAKAMARLCSYGGWLHRTRTEVRVFADINKDKASGIIKEAKEEKRAFLPEAVAHEVLEAYHFPVLAGSLGRDLKECISIAEKIGYPVVLKIVSPKIIHKVDFGGVRLNIKNAIELNGAYEGLISTVLSKKPDATILGVFVQKMAEKGKEIIIGMKRDPRFGPILMVGTGGTYVEAYQDVAFRLAPLTDLSAHHMINEIKGSKILKGFRGEPPSDIEMVADCIERISQLSLDLSDIEEIDINPLFVYEKGKGVAVVDARILIKV